MIRTLVGANRAHSRLTAGGLAIIALAIVALFGYQAHTSHGTANAALAGWNGCGPGQCVATNTWTGSGGDTSWATPGNWSYGYVPATNSEVVIPASTTAQPTKVVITSIPTSTVYSLVVNDAAASGKQSQELTGAGTTSTITTTNGITLAGGRFTSVSFAGAAAIALNQDTNHVAPDFTDLTLSTTGGATISATGGLTVHGTVALAGTTSGPIQIVGNGTADLNGLTVNGTGTDTFSTAAGVSARAGHAGDVTFNLPVTFSGATELDGGHAITSSKTITNAGALTSPGGAVTVTGGTFVNNGTVDVKSGTLTVPTYAGTGSTKLHLISTDATPGVGFSKLAITGAAALDAGTFSAVADGGFAPGTSAFRVISFASHTGTAHFGTNVTATTDDTGVTVKAADTDGDGLADTVDCAPTDKSKPAQGSGVVDANCDGIDDAKQPLVKTGGSGDDTIVGSVYADIVNGGAGNDHLVGGAGDDKLSGGSGNDNIDGGTGNDKLNGGSGNDKLAGGTGNDTIIGGTGSDTINGGPGNDKIGSKDGHKDTVVCGSGTNDHVYADAIDKVAKDCEHVIRV